MTKFHTKLVTSMPEIGLWLTEMPFVVETTAIGLLEIPAGFVFDGNSVRRITWTIHPPSDFLESGCVHDYLYHYGFGVSRKVADQVYRELLIHQGMSPGWAGMRYYALRLLGGSSYRAA